MENYKKIKHMKQKNSNNVGLTPPSEIMSKSKTNEHISKELIEKRLHPFGGKPPLWKFDLTQNVKPKNYPQCLLNQNKLVLFTYMRKGITRVKIGAVPPEIDVVCGSWQLSY